MATYKMDFHCRSCTKMQMVGKSWYCMPLRLGFDPIWSDDETRTIHCHEYQDQQLSMFDKEVTDK